VNLLGNLLTLFVYADDCCMDYHWSLYSFNLETWELENQINGGYFQPRGGGDLLTFSDTTLYLDNENVNDELTLQTLNLETFKTSFPKHSIPEVGMFFSAFGNPANNSLYGCAEFKDSKYEFVSIDVTTHEVRRVPNHLECPSPVYYTGPNPLQFPQPLVSATEIDSGEYINLALIDFNDPSIIIARDKMNVSGYPTELVTDGANAFIFGQLWEDQDITHVWQYSYATGIFTFLDHTQAPPLYGVGSLGQVVTYSASNALQQLAVTISPKVWHVKTGEIVPIWVINYDSN